MIFMELVAVLQGMSIRRKECAVNLYENKRFLVSERLIIIRR